MNSVLRQRLHIYSTIDPESAHALLLYAEEHEPSDRILPSDMQLCQPVQAWLKTPKPSGDQAALLVMIGCPTMTEYMTIIQQLRTQDRLFVIESDLSRAMHFMATNLVEGALQSGKLQLTAGVNRQLIKNKIFALMNPRHVPNICILDTEKASREHASFIYEVLHEAREEVRLEIFNAGTLVVKGPLWQFNTLKNMQRIVKNPGINRLRGSGQGRPAIVVGAGPSLNRALPILKELQNRFFIISTGTALRPLRKAGIRPHLVVAVDGSHLIAPQFETDCSDLYFVGSSLVYSEITNRFKGTFSGGLDASPLDHWIDEQIEPRGSLYAGGTVTCSAMYLAAIMDCTTVCTVGLDLCFETDGTTHADDTMYHGKRQQAAHLIPVRGNYASEVFTTQQFQCYIELVSGYVKNTPDTPFINVNDSGAFIDGMQLAPLSSLYDYAGSAFDAYACIEKVHNSFTPLYEHHMQQELQDVWLQLESISLRSSHAAELSSQIILQLHAPDSGTLERIRPLMQELSNIEEEFEQAKTSNQFILMSLWPAFYEFGVHLNDSATRTVAQQMETFKNFKKLYEQIAGAAKWTRDAIADTLNAWPPAPIAHRQQPKHPQSTTSHENTPKLQPALTI